MSNLGIPIISCISRYKKFLFPSLLSLIQNSCFSNQIIIVSEDLDLEKIIKNDFDIDFIFEHKNKTLTNHKVPYDLFNIGFKSTTKEFILTPTGDDNYYPKNWDKYLLQHAYICRCKSYLEFISKEVDMDTLGSLIDKISITNIKNGI